MLFLSPEEVNERFSPLQLRYEGAQGGHDAQLEIPKSYLSECFGTPGGWSAYRNQLALAMCFCDWMEKSSVVLVFQNWNVFSDAAMYRAFGMMRVALGEKELSLRERPGILCDLAEPNELWTTVAQLAFMMNHTWQGWLVALDGSRIIWIADDVIEWFARTSDDIVRMEQLIADIPDFFPEPA